MGYYMGYMAQQEDIDMIADMEPMHAAKRFSVNNSELYQS